MNKKDLKKQIKLYIKGYFSIIKNIFFIDNSRDFENIEIKNISHLLFLIFITGFIGIFRNYLQVKLGIFLTKKWYCFDCDINFVMTIYPIFFFLSTPMIFDYLMKKSNIKFSYTKFLSMMFYIQIVHLIIPFIDYIGLKLNINPFIPIFPKIQNSFFYGKSLMPLGVIIIWLLVIVFIYKLLKSYFIKQKIILIIGFFILNFYFWFIYHFWPFLNLIGNSIFKIKGDSYSNFYGYGFFFYFMSILGFFYYLKNNFLLFSKNYKTILLFTVLFSYIIYFLIIININYSWTKT